MATAINMKWGKRIACPTNLLSVNKVIMPANCCKTVSDIIRSYRG